MPKSNAYSRCRRFATAWQARAPKWRRARPKNSRLTSRAKWANGRVSLNYQVPMPTETKAAQPLTSRVAEFASATRFEDIPRDVIRMSKQAVLDCLAVAFAGSVAAGSDILRRHIAGYGFASGPATIYGSGMRVP